MRPPVSFSGYGRWRRMAEDLRETPGEWTRADIFDAEHRAANLQRHLHREYGLNTSVRRVSELKWEVWAAFPEGAA